MREVIDLFGAGLLALLVAAAAVYLVLAFMPLLWPAWRAFRAPQRLPRPWLFVGVVGAIVYGAVTFFVAAIGVPMDAYLVFIAPQLQEAKLPYGAAFVGVSDVVVNYWWVAAPVFQLLATWYLTRRLAARWERICQALA
ncbi:MAG TPA: hypothetical protein VGD42_19910 [Lysobacter sp.]